MFCPFCGTDNKQPTKFCGGCGKLLPEETAVVPPVTPPTEIKTDNTPQAKYKAPKINIKKTIGAPKTSHSSIINKKNIISAILILLQLGLYVGISVIMIMLINMQETIIVIPTSEKAKEIPLALSEMLNLMLNGNRLFNPAMTSTSLAIGAYIFIYSLPAVAGICFLGSLIVRKSKAFNAAFTIMSLLSEIYIVVTIHLTMILCPEIKQGIALYCNMIIGDVGGLTVTKIITWVSIAAALTIIAAIISAISKKRMNKA